MIVSELRNYEEEGHIFPEPLKKALKCIIENDYLNAEEGKYEIDGDKMFVMVQHRTTKLKADARPEAHNKYIDIQCVLQGEELLGFSRRNQGETVDEDLLEVKDAIFYKDVKNETELILSSGQFAIFFPNDIHRPWCSVNEQSKVKKVVMKIHVDLLK